MEDVLKIEHLKKRYGKEKRLAVDDLSFSVRAGEIVGLLGHNGAGKSTTLKCLFGMLPFEGGSIHVMGADVVREPIRAKRNFGFVTDDHAVFLYLTGYEYLSFMADIYKVPNGERAKRVKELDEVFRLGDALYRLISTYSHGMRQKICMMGSLLHSPRLWVLDEPMTGLDPRTMKAVKDHMKEYVRGGAGILFSSHALDTVARLCDRVVLLKGGKCVDELSKEALSQNNFNFEEYFLAHEE